MVNCDWCEDTGEEPCPECGGPGETSQGHMIDCRECNNG